jgi:hypothetical protein
MSDKAIKFLETAARNWEHIGSLSQDDLRDVGSELDRVEKQAAAEERAKIVAWLEKNAKLNPHLPEAMALVLLFSQAITKGAHLK